MDPLTLCLWVWATLTNRIPTDTTPNHKSPALMTPWTPVSWMHRSTSLRCCMLPLANTGMFTAFLQERNPKTKQRESHVCQKSGDSLEELNVQFVQKPLTVRPWCVPSRRSPSKGLSGLWCDRVLSVTENNNGSHLNCRTIWFHYSNSIKL